MWALRAGRALLHVALPATLLAATACGPAGESADRNLILITLDTTRADRLGCYGATSVKTPNLDGIAAAGTVFEQAFAVAPITAPSHASILSGTYPPYHRVRDNDLFSVPTDLPWLPTILKQYGYRTAGIVAAIPLRAGAGFSRGFDYFGDQLEAPPGRLVMTNLQTVGVPSRPGERISAEFELWLENNRGHTPFFVWLHYYDPHWPWEPGGGYSDLYAGQLYDGEVAYMDDCIGKVLRALARHGLSESTGLVVVADHGEGLGDHGELTHALLAYNSTLRVPLIVRLPWLGSQTPRVGASVSNADVMPTILDALGIHPQGLQAQSLMPLVTGESADPGTERQRLLYFETFYPYHHYRWSPLSGFVAGGRKFIHGPVNELYDLVTDPDEVHSLSGPEDLAAHATRLDELKVELRRDRPATSRREPDRAEIEQLRALGYAVSSAGADAEAVADLTQLANPRDGMDIFSQYNRISSLVLSNRIPDALDEATLIATADPKQKDARLMIGTFNARLGRFEAADRAFAELVRDFPDKDALLQAGNYFLARRDVTQAQQCFESLVAQDPDDIEALTLLGQAAEAADDTTAAQRLFEQALALDPGYRDALLGLAVLLDRLGSAAALQHFKTAVERFPFDPEVNFDYGIYLLRHGHDQEALERLHQAATLSAGPMFDAAQFALATFHRQRNEIDRARACLSEVVLRTTSPMSLRRAQSELIKLADD